MSGRALWLNYAAYNGEPILLAFHGGDKGLALEEFSDDEIVNSAMQTTFVSHFSCAIISKCNWLLLEQKRISFLPFHNRSFSMP